jgi:hypothetical protein
MSLPKIKHPLFEFVIPSTNKKETFRPFLVKEEKVLLMAKSSEDPGDIFRSIKQIINNCCVNKNFNVDVLTIFDLEYIFLQLRAVSVNNIVNVSYRDNDDGEDGEPYSFQIDLKEIKVKFPENIEKKIMVNDTVGLIMKYPAASIFDDKEFFDSGDEAMYELTLRCIDCIFDGEDVFDSKNYTKEELAQFLEDCDVNTYDKIQTFMSSTPRLYHKLEYTNSKGVNKIIELISLTDFFTLR